MREGSIFTFYSYKGGVGRTFALANVAALLSLWGYKVLCVDWDLEAPGLHLYFQKWLTGAANRRGLTELIQAYADGKTPRWRSYTTEVRFPDTREPLTFIGAGAQDESYVERMQALNWGRLYEKHDLGSHIEDLREKWRKEFDFILIDSRTGITDVGGICTAQLPDYLVLLFTANEQSLYGSVKVADLAREARSHLPFDRAKLLILPVVTRFEVRTEYALAQDWLGIFAEALTPLFGEWAHREVGAHDLLNFTRIPSFPYWSFGERLPVIEKGVDDPEDIGYAFETLAALVSHKLSYSEVLVKNRDAFVALARKGPGAGRASEEDVRRFFDQSVTRAIPVTTLMIPAGQFFYKDIDRHDPQTLKLGDLLEELERFDKTRIPLLGGDGQPLYVVHRSMIDKFIVQSVLSGNAIKSANDLTLADLLAEPEVRAVSEDMFVVVSRQATLAEAKSAMRPFCTDVFVTETGKSNEPVLGWLTNVDIARTN